MDKEYTLQRTDRLHINGGFGVETCSGVWYPRRRPFGVAINTSIDSINWPGNPRVFAGEMIFG